MSIDTSICEVTTYTCPDEIEWKSIRTREELSYSYDRIYGITVDDGVSGETSGVTRGKYKKHSFEMPREKAGGLLEAARVISHDGTMNCHRFSRFLHHRYTSDRSIDNRFADSFKPIVRNHTGLERVKALGMGAVGVIGVQGYGIPHSLVGLGDNTIDSIQVMTTGGEFGIASNEELFDFYRRLYSWSDDVDLYKLPDQK